MIQRVEKIARVCYKSEGNIGPGTAEKMVRKLIESGHTAMIEHGLVSVRFIVDRGVSHELVRHRIASWAQESTRYCDSSKSNDGQAHATFVIPPWVNLEPGIYHACNRPPLSDGDEEWFHGVLATETRYFNLRRIGWKPEQARSVLPNSLKTEVVMTANFRSLLNFFTLRCSPKAHPQMREVAIPYMRECCTLFPSVFREQDFLPGGE